ncbi:efflux transporter outer membrane subunit [Kangiella sp. HZ709]|uniref:efflux transporter outer membrane subunit n=1 Tax=Kangiella sp. HZ709 TaxID=2666328 RepID=UPI0012AF1B00|nr:TolC family protein [Kangiella sp. HZ709]MRX26874.1 efflux transporter outer membrane subunit [Kangiella sp. HZ709]
MLKNSKTGLVLLISFSILSCANLSTKDDVKSTINSSLPDIPDNWHSLKIDGEFENDFIDQFNDPILENLVNEALSSNNDLLSAAANVERSKALAEQAGASLKPMVNLAFGGTRSGGVESNTPKQTSLNANLQVQWELDLWGRVRSGAKTAYASYQAVEADYQYAKHSIAANVAKAYFSTLEAAKQETLLLSTLANLNKTSQIVNLQYKNGLASSQDVSLVKTDLANIQEQLETLKASKRQGLRALEILVGRYPSAEIDIANKLPVIPPFPNSGIPSELLERRPDIVAVERRVAAAFYALDQAKAAQLPTISLTSGVGGTSSELSNVLKPENLAWQLASNLLAPLFDGGLRESQVNAANADQKAAIAAYTQTVLTAFSEVENSLDSGISLQNRLMLLEEAKKESNNALRVAELNYNEGEIALLDVLTIQQRVTAAESSLVSVYRSLLEQRINIFLALGGEW